MQPVTYTTSRKHSIYFKQNKPSPQTTTNTTTLKKKKTTKKEAKAVKAVPQQGVALLLTFYQQVDCQSILCNTGLRAWTQQEGKQII